MAVAQTEEPEYPTEPPPAICPENPIPSYPLSRKKRKRTRPAKKAKREVEEWEEDWEDEGNPEEEVWEDARSFPQDEEVEGYGGSSSSSNEWKPSEDWLMRYAALPASLPASTPPSRPAPPCPVTAKPTIPSVILKAVAVTLTPRAATSIPTAPSASVTPIASVTLASAPGEPTTIVPVWPQVGVPPWRAVDNEQEPPWRIVRPKPPQPPQHPDSSSS